MRNIARPMKIAPQQQRERRPADEPDQVAHKTRPRRRTQRRSQIGVERLLRNETDTRRYGKDHRKRQFQHVISLVCTAD
jgi:hypothetical protein